MGTPPGEQTDTTVNITFPQPRWRSVKKTEWKYFEVVTSAVSRLWVLDEVVGVALAPVVPDLIHAQLMRVAFRISVALVNFYKY